MVWRCLRNSGRCGAGALLAALLFVAAPGVLAAPKAEPPVDVPEPMRQAVRDFVAGLRARNSGQLSSAIGYPFWYGGPGGHGRCDGDVADPAALLGWMRCLGRAERTLLRALRAEEGSGAIEAVTLAELPPAARAHVTPAAGQRLLSARVAGDGGDYLLVFLVETAGRRAVVRAFTFDADIAA